MWGRRSKSNRGAPRGTRPMATRREPPASSAADPWSGHVAALQAHGIPEPGSWRRENANPATVGDEEKLYSVAPSFVDLLPWTEFLTSQSLLLDDGVSVAGFFELAPIGTEGRDPQRLEQARDALENALQDSFEELEDNPWVVQFFAQDEAAWGPYLETLRDYVHPRARDSAFTQFHLKHFEHHLERIGKPGGLFIDKTVTQLPWRGQTRRVRMVVYRRVSASAAKRGPSPEQALHATCDRFVGALANAGIRARRMDARALHDWLLRWFNPHPTAIGTSELDRKRFYALTRYPDGATNGELEIASGRDFSQRLFFCPPRSDVATGTWYFDRQPHRVVVLDRLRNPPGIGHLTGETRTGGDAISALFDQLPPDTVLSLTLVITPQDILEGHLSELSRKSIGGTLVSEQTRQDVTQARTLIGGAHKLYRASLAFYLRGESTEQLEARARQLTNVMLNAGLQPVREEDEVAPLNSYLRWLPCVYDPAKDRRQWYSQLTFAQHVAHLLPVWGRSRGTGHPGITFFNRGGEPITLDPLNRLDRQMNAHMFFFGPTGSGKSATLGYILDQFMALYRPRLFIVEAGNSFGLFADFAKRFGLTIHRLKLAPGAGITLAPFDDAWRLIKTPAKVQTLDVEVIDEAADGLPAGSFGDEQRDVLGELEIKARLMITGGEEREDARMTRADRSMIRQCILDAARLCVSENRTTLTEDVREALRRRSTDTSLPEGRRTRLLEMADAIDIFCQGMNGEMFNRAGTSWPEADVTIVDLATYAREGYSAELSISYISLINAVNNLAERDQFLGRPIICATDEGHGITKNPLTAPYVVKITKMWRKLGAWFWLSTPSLDDLPPAAKPMLNMIEWWICLSMSPDEVEKIARFRELTPEQKALLLSARKQTGDFIEGVILSRSMEILFRAVLPSLNLALGATDLEEKNERFQLMQKYGISELDAALRVAARIDVARGIVPMVFDELG